MRWRPAQRRFQEGMWPGIGKVREEKKRAHTLRLLIYENEFVSLES